MSPAQTLSGRSALTSRFERGPAASGRRAMAWRISTSPRCPACWKRTRWQVAEASSWIGQWHNLLTFDPPHTAESHLRAAIGHTLIDRGLNVLSVGCMDRSSPAGLALALVLGSPPRKLLVVQHPAAPLWAGSRTALVAVGGAVLWWAVSCRVLLGFLGLFPAGRRVLLLGCQLFFQDPFSAPRSAGSQHWRRKPRPLCSNFC
jgi:hypothetical protein